MVSDQVWEQFLRDLMALCPFEIRYKNRSRLMQALHWVVQLYCPAFLTRFTTILGNRIYLPDSTYTTRHQEVTARILTHELVHLTDQRRVGVGLFSAAYLFPQILVLGVLLTPWMGWAAAWFLLALLPWPAPFRAWIECRAYALDMVMSGRDLQAEAATLRHHFTGWTYYRMMPVHAWARAMLMWEAGRIRAGERPAAQDIQAAYLAFARHLADARP
jgi:hypothetical protein